MGRGTPEELLEGSWPHLLWHGDKKDVAVMLMDFLFPLTQTPEHPTLAPSPQQMSALA